MSSYKEAHEKMNNTGEGFNGIEMETFQTYIVKNVCKYYFELDPVLRDRPNVYPWFTNEKRNNNMNRTTTQSTNQQLSVFLSDDSDDSSDDEIETISIAKQDSTRTRKIHNQRPNSLFANPTNTISNKNYSSSSSISDDNGSTIITSPSSSDNKCSSSSGRKSLDNRRTNRLPKKKQSPMDAKKKQKTVLSRKRKTIAYTKGKKKEDTAMQQKDRELIIESRRNKMLFEKKKHDDLKLIESEKLKIEKERLRMEKDSLEANQCYVRAQTNLENNKILLLKMDIYSKRQKIIRENPDITEEDLDKLFPFAI